VSVNIMGCSKKRVQQPSSVYSRPCMVSYTAD